MHGPSSPEYPRMERCAHFPHGICNSEVDRCAFRHRLATSFSVHANPSSVHQLPWVVPPMFMGTPMTAKQREFIAGIFLSFDAILTRNKHIFTGLRIKPTR